MNTENGKFSISMSKATVHGVLWPLIWSWWTTIYCLRLCFVFVKSCGWAFTVFNPVKSCEAVVAICPQIQRKQWIVHLLCNTEWMNHVYGYPLTSKHPKSVLLFIFRLNMYIGWLKVHSSFIKDWGKKKEIIAGYVFNRIDYECHLVTYRLQSVQNKLAK